MVALPTFLPLSEAARKYGVSEARLKAMIEHGKIKAAMIMGELVVNEQTLPLCRENTPEWEKRFEKFRGVGISISQAERDYGIPHPTIWRWMNAGFIKRLGTDKNRVLIDKADTAYCAKIYHSWDTKQGRRLFDKDGLPYKPKTGPLAV